SAASRSSARLADDSLTPAARASVPSVGGSSATNSNASITHGNSAVDGGRSRSGCVPLAGVRRCRRSSSSTTGGAAPPLPFPRASPIPVRVLGTRRLPGRALRQDERRRIRQRRFRLDRRRHRRPLGALRRSLRRSLTIGRALKLRIRLTARLGLPPRIGLLLLP